MDRSSEMSSAAKERFERHNSVFGDRRERNMFFVCTTYILITGFFFKIYIKTIWACTPFC